MTSIRQQAQHRRLRVVAFYENAWEFIVRLLMGLGIYIVLRIILMSYLTRVQGIALTFADSLAELSVLLLSAILMILFIWFKGSRSHLATALWMPAILCLVIADSLRLFHLIMAGHTFDAIWGYLPFLIPLILMLLYWALDPDSLIFRIAASLFFLAMSIFWVSDIPKSLQEAKDVQSMVRAYQEFSMVLQEDHMLDFKKSPRAVETKTVTSVWHSKLVNQYDYKLAEDIPEVENIYYVMGTDIIISGVKEELKESTQVLSYAKLEYISLHYFFKYVTSRKIVTRDFQYTGNAFFIVKLKNKEALVVDNVLVRKQTKEAIAS